MNIVQLQDQLKNFSQDQLVREMQMPSGNAPQFLVLGEIMRRQKMQQDFTAQQAKGDQGTVAQEAVAAAGVPQGGIADMARAMAPSTDMTQNTGVQAMYAGGFVKKMAPGGVVEVPGYLDSGRAEASPNNPARNSDLLAALSQSARGAEFAEFLNSVGQGGIDIAAKLFRKTGAAGMQLDAELGMIMAQTAGFLGFPEKAAEFRESSRNQAAYAQNMAEGKIDIFGNPTAGNEFTLPDSARRMIDAAEVARTVEQGGPALTYDGSFSEPLQGIPESIIQSRNTPPPEAMTSMPGLASPRFAGPASMAVGGDRPPVIPTPEGLAAIPGSAPALPYMDVVPSSPARLPQGDAYMEPEKYRAFYDDLTKAASGLDDRVITAGGLASRFVGVNPSYTEEGSAAASDARLAEQEALRDEQEARTRAVDFMRYSPQAQPEEPVGFLESAASAAAKELAKVNQRQNYATEDLTGMTEEELLAPMAPTSSIRPRTRSGAAAEEVAKNKPAGGAGGAGGMSSYEQELMNMLQKREKAAEQDKWLSLAQVGLNLMSSTQPTLGGALGEAGLKGVEAARSARDQYDKDRLSLLGELEKSRAARGKAAAGAARKALPVGAVSIYDTEIEAIENVLGGFSGSVSEGEKLKLRRKLDALVAQRNQLQRDYLTQFGYLPAGASPAAGSGVVYEDVPS